MSDISTAPTLIPGPLTSTSTSTPTTHPSLSSKELQALHDLQALHSIQSTLLRDAPPHIEEEPDLSSTAVNLDTLLRQAQSMIATLVAEKRGKSRRIRILEEELHAAREKGRVLVAEAEAEAETRGKLKMKAGAEEAARKRAEEEGGERVSKLEGEVKGLEAKVRKVEGEREERVKGVERELKEQVERNKGLERDLKAKGTLVQELTARLNKKKGEGKEQAMKLAKVTAANEELRGALNTARKRAENAAQRAQETEEQVKLERKRRRKAEKELKGVDEDARHGQGHGHGHGQGERERRAVYGSVSRSKSSVISRMFRGV